MPAKKDIKKREPRTLKEKKFVKAYLETGNATEAAGKVYNVSSYRAANAIGGQNLVKLDMTHWLDAAGLTNEVIAQNTTRIALTSKRDQFTGEETSDDAMQLKGMQFAAQLKNLIVKEDSGGNNTFFQFIQNQQNGYIEPK